MSRLHPRLPDCVLENKLYIGSLDSARHISQNPETDITHIVSLCEQADFLDDGCKIQQLVVDIDDAHFTDVLRHLPEILAFMDRAIDGGGAVLVHCYYGISRSATVVAAYIMKYNRCAPTEAIEIVRKSRPVIDPNPGFIKQLELFHQWRFIVDVDGPKYADFRQDVRKESELFIAEFLDIFTVPEHNILLCQELPYDLEQIGLVAEIHKASHFLEVPPSQVNAGKVTTVQHLSAYSTLEESQIPKYIQEACESVARVLKDPKNMVLIHGFDDKLLRLVFAAILMRVANKSIDDAIGTTFDVKDYYDDTEQVVKDYLKEWLPKLAITNSERA